jgi:hypothetical protein
MAKSRAKAKPPAAESVEALKDQLEAVKAALDPDGFWELGALEQLASYRMDELHEAERDAGACDRLLDVVEELEHEYRHRGLNEIRGAGGEHPLFAELWRAAAAARGEP